jgi:hypothetical protein
MSPIARCCLEENMDKIMREVEQLKEKLLVYEHWAIMGKLITCTTQELQSIGGSISLCLLLALEKENNPGVKSHLNEALKYLNQMSLIIDSMLSCATSGTQNLIE